MVIILFYGKFCRKISVGYNEYRYYFIIESSKYCIKLMETFFCAREYNRSTATLSEDQVNPTSVELLAA